MSTSDATSSKTPALRQTLVKRLRMATHNMVVWLQHIHKCHQRSYSRTCSDEVRSVLLVLLPTPMLWTDVAAFRSVQLPRALHS
jgi:hypothetical protein